MAVVWGGGGGADRGALATGESSRRHVRRRAATNAERAESSRLAAAEHGARAKPGQMRMLQHMRLPRERALPQGCRRGMHVSA